MGKDKQKECIKHGCKNTAGKESYYCGLHKPKTVKKHTPCHTGNILIGAPQGVSLYCGGSSRSGGWWRMLPYPDLAIGPDEIILKNGPKPLDPRWLESKSGAYVSEKLPILLALDWPDFKVPLGHDGKELPREFWLALVDDIFERGIKTVSLQCMGGHGRTGIQACILLHLLTPEAERTWKDVAELLAHLHEIYCDQAVEGDSQAEYIARMCGIPAGEYKLHHFRATSFGGGFGVGGWDYGDYDYHSQVAEAPGALKFCGICKEFKPAKEVMLTSGRMTCDDCYESKAYLGGAGAGVKAKEAETITDIDDTEATCVCNMCDDEIDWDARGTDCRACFTGVYIYPDEVNSVGGFA